MRTRAPFRAVSGHLRAARYANRSELGHEAGKGVRVLQPHEGQGGAFHAPTPLVPPHVVAGDAGPET